MSGEVRGAIGLMSGTLLDGIDVAFLTGLPRSFPGITGVKTPIRAAGSSARRIDEALTVCWGLAPSL
jgi:1,6-anhydro-N-acetylmuramate kinase